MFGAAYPFIIGFGIAFIAAVLFVALDIVIIYMQNRRGRGING